MRVTRATVSESLACAKYFCDFCISALNVSIVVCIEFNACTLNTSIASIAWWMFVNAASSLSMPIVDDAACSLIATLWVASSFDVDSIMFDVVVLSAVIWSSTSRWFASAWATITAVRSAEIVVVVARSTPLISSMLFFRMRSIAR